MKRAAECSGCSLELAGDCAVSVTKRVKLEEPEAADGITRPSPKLAAADGAGISMKIMTKLEEFDKKRAEEKCKRSNQEKRIEEMLMRIEKMVSQVEEHVAGDGMKKEKKTKKPEGNEAMGDLAGKEAGGMMKKKKVVTWRLSQDLLDYLRTKEVMGLLATEAPLPLWASKMGGALFDLDQRLKEEIAAEFQENREFDAHVLYQYRTYGYAEIEEAVSNQEDDVEVDEKKP